MRHLPCIFCNLRTRNAFVFMYRLFRYAHCQRQVHSDFWLILYKEFTLQPYEFLGFRKEGLRHSLFWSMTWSRCIWYFRPLCCLEESGKNMLSGAAICWVVQLCISEELILRTNICFPEEARISIRNQKANCWKTNKNKAAQAEVGQNKTECLVVGEGT
jgi:hypothetical protein